MMISKTKIIRALALASSALIAACGDSSGPGSVDAKGALQSLALSVQDGNTAFGSMTTPDIAEVFGGIAPLLTTATVSIDGTNQSMFAMGLRTSFPAGTCEEALFVDPAFPPELGACTPPSLNTVLVFWQSHSANEPPDRLLFIVTDDGMVGFDFSATDFDVTTPTIVNTVFPAFGLYLQGQNDVWASLSGSITTSVASMNQPCNLPAPPYAKSSTCSFAAFDEQAQIVFEPFSFDLTTFSQTPTRQMTIAIPRQTLHGLWLSVGEIQPVTFSVLSNRVGTMAPRLDRAGPRFIRAR
jgi:hypothetical protein